MADLASKYPSGANGVATNYGGALLPHYAANGSITNVDAATTTTRVSTAAGFWTNLAAQGTAVDSNYTADTYKTILSVSGAGYVYHIIGPAAGGAETTTFELTIDGVLKEFAVATVSGSRAFLSAAYATNQDIFGGTVSFAAPRGSLNAGKTTMTAADSGILLPNQTMDMFGSQRIVFKTSFLLRIKHSANVTGTASNERQSGVYHRTFLA